MALIALAEYAARHGITLATARQRAGRGVYTTAQKIGRNWLIEESEPHIDHRETGKPTAKIGWCIVGGYRVYVEGGRVLRGVSNGVAVYPYRAVSAAKGGGWDKDTPLVATLRAGLCRGSWRMM